MAKNTTKQQWMVASGNLTLILGYKVGYLTADECLLIMGAMITKENLEDFNKWVDKVLAQIKQNIENELNICKFGLFCDAEVEQAAEDDAAARMEKDA